jgi:hypothetical protein
VLELLGGDDGMGDFLQRSAANARNVRIRRAIQGFIGLLSAIGILTLVIFVVQGSLVRHPSTVEYVWVQLLPTDNFTMVRRLARAIITHGDHCPDILVGSQHWQMSERPPRVSGAFPILLCEREIDGTTEASIGQYQLPARVHEPDTFLVIGDTGCRVVHYEAQKCNDTDDSGWPFASVASNGADHLKGNVDSIIIHVGDYHYREKGCPDTNVGCRGNPFGDNWATWNAEFFEPARPLLAAAPWVMMRGNHENCARAGAGYLFFFGFPEQKYDGACEDDIPPYSIAIGHTEKQLRVLMVFDTANEKDTFDFEERCRDYANWVEKLNNENEAVWLGIHQPLWLYETAKGGTAKTTPLPGSDCDNAKSALDVIRAALIAPGFDEHHKHSVAAILSGDTHMFQFIQPEMSGVPVQIVAGNGGTKLDDLHRSGEPARTDKIVSSDMESYGVKGKFVAIARHGFVIIRRDESIWKAILYDSAGRETLVCGFSDAPQTPTRSAPAQLPCQY